MIFSRLNLFASTATEESRESSWTLFRLLVAAVFLTHGYDKLLGESPQEPVGGGMTNLDIGDLISYPVPLDINLLFAAGVVELAGGVLILIGLWTHLASLLALITMAYLIAHLAWFPPSMVAKWPRCIGQLSLYSSHLAQVHIAPMPGWNYAGRKNDRKRWEKVPDLWRRSQSGFTTE